MGGKQNKSLSVKTLSSSSMPANVLFDIYLRVCGIVQIADGFRGVMEWNGCGDRLFAFVRACATHARMCLSSPRTDAHNIQRVRAAADEDDDDAFCAVRAAFGDVNDGSDNANK